MVLVVTQGRTPAMIIAALLILLGIIHLGVGIGTAARYGQFDDVFRQLVGLAAFCIVIGLFGIAVGALSLMSVMQERHTLRKVAAICAGILGILATASFIVALALNSQAVSFVRTNLWYHMYKYDNLHASDNTMHTIQTRFQCCGGSSWVDWSRTPLGVGIAVGAGTSGGSIPTGGTTSTSAYGMMGISIADGVEAVLSDIEHQLNSYLLSKLLAEMLHSKRQMETGSTIYGLPSYSLKLPPSCCTTERTTTTNVTDGYCVVTAKNGTEDFSTGGCIPPVADAAVSHTTGIAVISTIMAVLAFVLLPILLYMFPDTFERYNSDDKQPLSNELQQEQQDKYGAYRTNNSNPNSSYNHDTATNGVPINTVPTNTVPTNTVPTNTVPTNTSEQ